MNILSTKEINYSNNKNIFLRKKREKDIMIQSVEKDTKYRFDNLKR